jgi:hypothetical protein
MVASEGAIDMIHEFHRLNLELELFNARRRADEYRPYTPAWDAAIGEVEDLERALWRLDHSLAEPARPGAMITEASPP